MLTHINDFWDQTITKCVSVWDQKSYKWSVLFLATETDVMGEFLRSETDIIGERNFMFSYQLLLSSLFFTADFCSLQRFLSSSMRGSKKSLTTFGQP
jgi:hypothetical protein